MILTVLQTQKSYYDVSSLLYCSNKHTYLQQSDQYYKDVQIKYLSSTHIQIEGLRNTFTIYLKKKFFFHRTVSIPVLSDATQVPNEF